MSEKNKDRYYENYDKIRERTKIYYEKNKEYFAEKSKTYYRENIELVKEKQKIPLTCECGSVFTTTNKSQHLKSKKHQEFINSKA